MKWILILALLVGMQAQAANQVKISATEIIVKFKSSILSGRSLKALDTHRDISGFMSRLTSEDIGQARVISKDPWSVTTLIKLNARTNTFTASKNMRQRNKDILWAYPNRIYYGEYREGMPNDPEISKQYHLKQIKAFESFALQLGRPEVVIAVTDDGFDLDHQDLLNSWHVNKNEIPNNQIDDDQNGYIDDVMGWDFNGKTNNPDYDGSYGGHGTHIAGIINGTQNNGIGITGVAPGLKIMPLKFYGKSRWTSAMVYETYAYATNNGAQIITTSYNVNAMSRDPIYRNAIRYAHDRNVLVFNSAGNGNEKDPERSRMDTLLLVASLDSSSNESAIDKRSSFSNYGYQVDISAPGGGIMATGTNDRYVAMSGTSMSTPMAAAVAGLVMSQNPGMNIRQILHTFLVSVDSVYNKNPKFPFDLGTGRINALKAVDQQIEPLRIFVPGIHANQENIKTIPGDSLQIRFQGAPGATIKPVLIISKATGKVVRELPLPHPLMLGTNQLNYTFDKLASGAYQLHIAEDAFVDPFGRAIDGNFDGEKGGDLVLDFRVK